MTADALEHGIPPNPYNPHCWITHEPKIGEGTWIGAFTLLDGRGGLTIGRNCDISCGAQIVTHSTVRRCLSERRYNKIDTMPTVIEDSVIWDEVTIGSGAIIRGSIVSHGTTIDPGIDVEGMVICDREQKNIG